MSILRTCQIKAWKALFCYGTSLCLATNYIFCSMALYKIWARASYASKDMLTKKEERPAVIQGAQQLLHTMTWLDQWPDADERTRVVFITQGIVRAKLRGVIEVLNRMSSRTFKAREQGRLAQQVVRSTEEKE
jgi:hypothetical protein